MPLSTDHGTNPAFQLCPSYVATDIDFGLISWPIFQEKSSEKNSIWITGKLVHSIWVTFMRGKEADGSFESTRQLDRLSAPCSSSPITVTGITYRHKQQTSPSPEEKTKPETGLPPGGGWPNRPQVSRHILGNQKSLTSVLLALELAIWLLDAAWEGTSSMCL